MPLHLENLTGMAFRQSIEPALQPSELPLRDCMRRGGNLRRRDDVAQARRRVLKALAMLPGCWRWASWIGETRDGQPMGHAQTRPWRWLRLERILGEVSMGRLVAIEEQQVTMRSFEPLIDNAAAAELLKIHPKTLQRMARRGEVPAVRIGRYWRFRASQLDSWVQSQVNSSRQPCRTESLL